MSQRGSGDRECALSTLGGPLAPGHTELTVFASYQHLPSVPSILMKIGLKDTVCGRLNYNNNNTDTCVFEALCRR